MDALSNQQIHEAGLDDWRKLAQALHARFTAADAAAAIAFVAVVAQIAQAEGRRPEFRLAGRTVDVSVGTRVDGVWVTAPDIDLAATISKLAREHALGSEPAEVTQLEIGLDTADASRIGPFWSALLTGSTEHKIHDTVLDPSGRVPNVWFQGTEPHELPRQRWHFDLWLAPEAADGRIAAAVAAGGTVVDDSQAPAYTVLADPDGNRACVCTSLDRG